VTIGAWAALRGTTYADADPTFRLFPHPEAPTSKLRSNNDMRIVTLNEVKGTIPAMVPFAALRVTTARAVTTGRVLR
jgi:hypothetical protein